MKEFFQIVVGGCTGGPRENNLSAYFLSALNQDAWIALDAGTLLAGIEKAFEIKSLTGMTPGKFLCDDLKAYLISHAHLDHIAGLVLNSQIDTPKSILGIDPTIDNLRDHVFNGIVWPNYGNEGIESLNRYSYIRLPLHQKKEIPNTHMTVEAFLLSHPGGYPSTAFLIESRGRYLLYFGDTGSDFRETEKHLTRVWKRIAPLIREKRLHAIMLECSYAQEDAQHTVYGHLDTKLLHREMEHLAEIVGEPLEGLNLIVTHRKEKLGEVDMKRVIEKELRSANKLNLNLIFPIQGGRILI